MEQEIINTVSQQTNVFDCMTITNAMRENGIKVDHHDVAITLDIMRERKMIERVQSSDATKYKVVV